MSPDAILSRLAELEGRLARVEARVGAPRDGEDEVLETADAARLAGFGSVGGFRKVLRRDPSLARAYARAPGRRSRLRWSRRKLLAWIEARS